MIRGIFSTGQALLTAMMLSACTTAVSDIQTVQTTRLATQAESVNGSGKDFALVTRRIEPVAEQVCRESGRAANCDFKIVIDRNPDAPSNAYQSLENSGRPVITFTQRFITEARNDHELALVMGHEAAHHIMNHIPRQQASATGASVLAGMSVILLGGDQALVDLATDIGGTVGARGFSKQHELEADNLGARIAKAAGYDPLIGVELFTRIPDPGDAFLGTHPANGDRRAVVANALR